MTGIAAGWRELSGPEKFRIYTRLSLQGGIVVAVVSLAVGVGDLWSVVGLSVAGLAAIVALELQPDLATRPGSASPRWALVLAGVVQSVIWATAAAVANISSSAAVADGARGAAVGVAILAGVSILPFVDHHWWVLAIASIGTGLALGMPSGETVTTMVAVALIGFVSVRLVKSTMWGLHMVDDLERARHLEAELQVAEERLRFARDLHDVVGRSLSAIAVKSELAATLLRAGAADRAAAEMNEVKEIAAESMSEMRQIVRGYRDIDLANEVNGARSLLAATGCQLTVEGDTAQVPPQCHELAAWVVREGTTNIVKHSSAHSATLTLGRSGMSLRNDGTRGVPARRSGLGGLQERLAAGGATLETIADGETFILQIHWESL